MGGATVKGKIGKQLLFTRSAPIAHMTGSARYTTHIPTAIEKKWLCIKHTLNVKSYFSFMLRLTVDLMPLLSPPYTPSSATTERT